MSKNPYLIETFKKKHLNKINLMSYNFWGEKGIYNNSYYLKLISQKISLCLKFDSKIIGACLCEDLKYKRSLISLLMIEEKYQNKGFGKLLLSFCIDNLKSKNYNFCILQVNNKNSKAIHLYENLGFFKINFLEDYYKDEEDSDAFLMAKYLYKPKFDYECFNIKLNN